MVYNGLNSNKLSEGPRDILSTNNHDANKLVFVGLDDLASANGHIEVIVSKNENSFKVIILDDAIEKGRIKSVHKPYQYN